MNKSTLTPLTTPLTRKGNSMRLLSGARRFLNYGMRVSLLFLAICHEALPEKIPQVVSQLETTVALVLSEKGVESPATPSRLQKRKNLNATVTDVFLAVAGLTVTAPVSCGTSGLVAYVSDVKEVRDPVTYNATGILDLSFYHLRTRDSTTYRLTLPLSRWNPLGGSALTSSSGRKPTFSVEGGAFSIACAQSGTSVMLQFTAGIDRRRKAVRLMLVDVQKLRAIDLGQATVVGGLPFLDQWINAAFDTSVLPADLSRNLKKYGVENVSREFLDKVLGRMFQGEPTIRTAIRNKDIWVFATPRNKGVEDSALINLQRATTGNGEVLVTHCKMGRLVARSNLHPVGGSISLLASESTESNRAQTMRLRIEEDAKGCEMKVVSEPLDFRQKGFSAILVAPDTLAMTKVSIDSPVKGQRSFTTALSLQVRGHVKGSLAFSHPFHGWSDFAWEPLLLGKEDEFTLLYGPGGRGSAFLHVWKKPSH